MAHAIRSLHVALVDHNTPPAALASALRVLNRVERLHLHVGPATALEHLHSVLQVLSDSALGEVIVEEAPLLQGLVDMCVPLSSG